MIPSSISYESGETHKFLGQQASTGLTRMQANPGVTTDKFLLSTYFLSLSHFPTPFHPPILLSGAFPLHTTSPQVTSNEDMCTMYS